MTKVTEFKERYKRNEGLVTPEEQRDLASKRVLVAGAGGLGGYAVESLARLGVGHITVVDNDTFDETNLNRQLLSTEALIGTSKALAAVERVHQVNSEVEVTALQELILPENAQSIIEGHDVVVDALDSAESRAVLLGTASDLGIPSVHASIGGWSARVAVCLPGNQSLIAFASQAGAGIEKVNGCPPFTAAFASSLEVAQVVKILLGRSGVEDGVLLEFDLLRNELAKIPLERVSEHT